MMRAILFGLVAASMMVSVAAAADLAGVVKKPSVDVYAEPKLDAPKLSTLKRDAAVTISAQQGLWYELRLTGGGTGYVRVNDVRLAQAATASSGSNLQSLTAGQAGAGRVTETAGVRGIDESDLKTAAFNQAELDKMAAYRVADAAAAAHAVAQGWESTKVAYSAEAKPAKKSGASGGGGSSSGGGAISAAKSMFGSISSGISSALGTAEKAVPKSEEEQSAEELALGPQIAGRALGARPLWSDDAAQKRVNVIGRWVASQTSRPDLPWSFGIIDTPEINAFAAPGGYILVTRGLYEILSSDGEVAAVLGHEISHCVQRDHYNVIRKQEMASSGKDLAMGEVREVQAQAQTQNQVTNAALDFALQYVEKHGATILLTSLDRAAEYRADEAAEIYVARAGMNPLALYAVLQKMASLGRQSSAMAQLYKTHPALDDRMDRIDQRKYEGLKAYTLRE